MWRLGIIALILGSCIVGAYQADSRIHGNDSKSSGAIVCAGKTAKPLVDESRRNATEKSIIDLLDSLQKPIVRSKGLRGANAQVKLNPDSFTVADESPNEDRGLEEALDVYLVNNCGYDVISYNIYWLEPANLVASFATIIQDTSILMTGMSIPTFWVYGMRLGDYEKVWTSSSSDLCIAEADCFIRIELEPLTSGILQQVEMCDDDGNLFPKTTVLDSKTGELTSPAPILAPSEPPPSDQEPQGDSGSPEDESSLDHKSPGRSAPTAVFSTSSAPVTLLPVTLAPISISPVTLAPVTLHPISPAPITSAPITLQPNTPSPISPQPTTPQPTTHAPITLSPTNPQPVTPAPITPVPITPAPITSSPTTLQPITPSPTTPQPTTPQPTTPQPTTPQPTTPQPTTPQPTTPQPTTPQPTTPQPTTPQPTTPQPTTPQPTTPQPTTPQPTTPQPTTPQPTTPQPTTPAPVSPPPTTQQPTAPEPLPTSPQDAAASWLAEHNIRRRNFHALHGVEPVDLKLSESLTENAQTYANLLIAQNGCSLTHAQGEDAYGGENLAANYGWRKKSRTIPEVLTAWFDNEINLPNLGQKLHATQVVWRSTHYLGCASAEKNMGGENMCYIQVCRYIANGNCFVNPDKWLENALSKDYSTRWCSVDKCESLREGCF